MDFTFVSDILDTLVSFFDWLFFYFGNLEYWISSTLEYWFKWFIYGSMFLANIALSAAYSVSTEILTDLNISGSIDTGLQALSSEAQQILYFFRIPECINLVISAFATKMVLKFAPFSMA